MDEFNHLLKSNQAKNHINRNRFNIQLLIAGSIYFVIFILPNIIFALLPQDTTVGEDPTQSDILFGSVLNFAIYAFVGGIFIGLLYKYYWIEIKAFFKKPGFNILMAGGGWFVGIITMLVLGMIMTYGFGVCETSENQKAIQDSLAYPLLIIPPVVLLAPIVEETFFRGILFEYITKIPLPKVISVGLAFIVSSFLFGFIHIIGEVFAGNYGEFVQILPYMALGLILAIVYYFTNNIIVPIILHMIQNTFSIVMSYLYLFLDLPEDTTNTCELMVRAFVSLFN